VSPIEGTYPYELGTLFVRCNVSPLLSTLDCDACRTETSITESHC
jgi:hypothetical protein